MALVNCNAEFSPLKMQKGMLEMNPHADYMLWVVMCRAWLQAVG
jgi:hypothetical protein